MTYCKVYEKAGDWKGTTRMKQDVQLSFHNGFADMENRLVIESDICYIQMNLYACDGYTGEMENKYPVVHTLVSVKTLDILIDALTRARDHHSAQHGIWKDNGKVWLSSGCKRDLGSIEEQNRIYNLPWEEVTAKYLGDKRMTQ